MDEIESTWRRAYFGEYVESLARLNGLLATDVFERDASMQPGATPVS